MLFILLLPLISSLSLCQGTNYTELYNSVELLTEQSNSWNDWILQNATQTFQGPATDERFSGFKLIQNKSLVLSSVSAISFSVRSPFEIKFSVVSLQANFYNEDILKDSSSNSWIHYTVIISNGTICLFENDNYVTTFTDLSISHIECTATENIIWKIHEYPLRTADHISIKPTTINISRQISNLKLYAYLCAHCYLEVILPKSGQQILAVTKTNFPQLWKPVTLFITKETNMTLIRKTINGRYDGYWAVDIRPSQNEQSGLNNKTNLFANETCDCVYFKNLEESCKEDCQNAPRVEFSHVELINNSALMVYWNINEKCKIDHFKFTFQTKTHATKRFSNLLENLKTCTKYTISVATVVNGNSGKEANKTVQMMPPPTPPQLVSIILDKSSRIITFKLQIEKENKCGFIELFTTCHSYTRKLQLFHSGNNSSDYYAQDEYPTNTTISCTSFTTNFVQNSSKYPFTLFETQAGVYNFTFTIPFETKKLNDFYNISIKVHEIKCSYNETHPEIAKITHELTYNTSWKHYKVCYSGERNGFSNLTDCIMTNQTSTDLFLQPLRKYSINVTVVTETFTSPSISLPIFESKPGVPVLNASFTPSIRRNAKTNFTLLKNSFSDVNGKIIAYALILSKKEWNQTNFGFWNGSNETWPSLPEDSRQLTPNFWNPFKDKNHYLFVIGSGDECHEEIVCNPPLEPNKEYWLIVRAFTLTAYKDSSFLFFKTESDTVKSKILYSLFSLIIFFSMLFIVVMCKICLKLKTNRTLPTSENEAESTNFLFELEMFTVIEVAQFDQFLSNQFPDKLKLEFDTFLMSETQPITIALQPFNINKNRKKDKYLPYDSNRVILRNLPGVSRGNYINASYIDGYNRTKAYIAAQGPKFSTIKNFWSMIWQENIEIIVMGSNTFENKQRMCAEYWPPKENVIFECGRMTITTISQSIHDCYIRRKFEVFYDGNKKVIVQFQIKWISDSKQYFPNHLLPALKFLQENENMSNPILVHSGYGVGRTGVIILCDLALQMIKEKGKVDFYYLTKILKLQRHLMIKNLEHYALAHITVKEYIMDQENPFQNSVDRTTRRQQLEYLEILSSHDSVLQKMTPEIKIERKGLPSIPTVLRYGDGGKFLVSQEPKFEDFALFWITVADESIEYIIFLNKKIPFRNISFKGKKEVIQLNFVTTNEASFCTVKKFSLLIYDAVSKEIIVNRNVYVLEFNEWKPKSLLPSSIEHFVQLVDAVNKILRKPILVLCSDGSTASGLFVVVSHAIEQYKAELEVDVCAAIRVGRRSGRKFVESEKQLKYIHKCVTEFCRSNERYQTIDFA